jgi:predicted MFS family arabinose efflux permease
LRGTLATAAGNPRLALAYGAAFIGRGDFKVVGIFTSLWIVQVGMEHGMSPGAATARAGLLSLFIHGPAMLWAFFMGMITDRLDRITNLCIALSLAGCGYLLMGQVHDPFGSAFIPIAILLGIGEASVIVAGGALLGQEALLSLRGPIVGSYNAVGGIGILLASYGGGLLFDSIGRTAPFTVMGLLNIVLLLVAAAVKVRERNAVRLTDIAQERAAD